MQYTRRMEMCRLFQIGFASVCKLMIMPSKLRRPHFGGATRGQTDETAYGHFSNVNILNLKSIWVPHSNTHRYSRE